MKRVGDSEMPSSKRQQLEQFRKRKQEESKKKLAERPPWRPAGRNTTSRPLKAPYEAPKPAKRIHSARIKKSTSASTLPRPKTAPNESKTSQAGDLILPNTGLTPITSRVGQIIIDEKKEEEELEQTETELPKPNELPLNNQQPVADIIPQEDDSLGTKKWLKVYEESRDKLLTYQSLIETWSPPTDDDYWITEVDRVKGDVTLFLGSKSKHTQFHKMCLDPGNDKFKVEKEDDLQAFWDGMVFPSIEDFYNRAEWLKKASDSAWEENYKGTKPVSMIGKSPARPKENRPPKKMTEEEIKKAQESKERKLRQKKLAEERRAAMRKMMMEKKKAQMRNQEETEEGGVALVLTNKTNEPVEPPPPPVVDM